MNINMKMPKTIYKFPVKIMFECEIDKIYLMPELEIINGKVVGSFKKKIWIFPHKMEITKELRNSLKKMLK